MVRSWRGSQGAPLNASLMTVPTLLWPPSSGRAAPSPMVPVWVVAGWSRSAPGPMVVEVCAVRVVLMGPSSLVCVVLMGPTSLVVRIVLVGATSLAWDAGTGSCAHSIDAVTIRTHQ